jgi:hypothetical protein
MPYGLFDLIAIAQKTYVNATQISYAFIGQLLHQLDVRHHLTWIFYKLRRARPTGTGAQRWSGCGCKANGDLDAEHIVFTAQVIGFPRTPKTAALARASRTSPLAVIIPGLASKVERGTTIVFQTY